jgi:hypothetical protein
LPGRSILESIIDHYLSHQFPFVTAMARLGNALQIASFCDIIHQVQPVTNQIDAHSAPEQYVGRFKVVCVILQFVVGIGTRVVCKFAVCC